MNTREIAVGLAKKNLVDCIYSSACVDGLNITLQQTQDILQDAKLEGVKANDVLFVINMRDAWRFVLDTLDESVNAMYVQWLNNMCVHSLRYGSGAERMSDAYVKSTSYEPPMPQDGDVVFALQALRKKDDPVERAIQTFGYLANAEIFVDGNKRVALLVANQILISSGVGILKIPDTSVSSFSECLLDYHKTGGDSLSHYLREECLIRAQAVDIVSYNGLNFTVQEVISVLPEAARNMYSSERACAEANVKMYYDIFRK